MRLRVALGALTMAAGLFVACDEGEDSRAGGGASGSRVMADAGGTEHSGGGGQGGSDPASGGRGGLFGGSGCGNVSPVSPVCSLVPEGTGGTPPDAGASHAFDAGSADASDGPSEPCTGCLELRASVTNNDESAFFLLEYDTPVDMSQAGASITFRVSGLAPEDQVRVAPFIFDSTSTFAPAESIELTVSEGFLDIQLELDELTSGDLDKSSVLYVGLFVGYTGGIGAESSQNVALLLDSVTFSGADTANLAFTTDNEGFDRTDLIGVPETQVVHR